ncbi:MAG: hypothetical protein AAF907_01500 [Planctomycetota bacterium]
MAEDPWSDDSRDGDDFGADSRRFPDEGPNGELPAPAKSGMGCGLKILLALIVGGGLFAVLCCGGVVWEFSSSELFVPDTTPAAVRATTDETITIDIPEDFTPIMAMSGEFPFFRWFADFRMAMVAYQTPGDGQMFVMKVVAPEEGGNRAQMETQTRQGFNQNNSSQVLFDVKTTETKTLTTADGMTIDWQFSEGTGRDQSGADLGAFREVSGSFEDDEGVFILQLTIPEEEYDEEEITGMLESIAIPKPGE